MTQPYDPTIIKLVKLKDNAIMNFYQNKIKELEEKFEMLTEDVKELRKSN